ncbi:hypothetical protein EPN29_09720 [bacterium]|nr:MAG: hypothetical protein EPN29_09720 [bacterium]
MWERLLIEGTYGDCRWDEPALVDEDAAGLAEPRPGLACAILLVAAAAMALAALPSAIALGTFPSPADDLVLRLGVVAAVLAGVKLAAMAWGLAGRLWARFPASVAAANVA